LCPESLDKDMDIGVLGEGEVTFLELINSLIQRGELRPDALSGIPGIVYWESDKLHTTKKRELIRLLDEIPFPDRSLFGINVNKAYMFSSRGCPYNCIFCASSRLWEKVRFYSAEYVFNEIKELIYRYGVKKINFADDLFIADRKRIEELGMLLEREGLTKKVQFHVSARANLINDALCSALKKINVAGISLGLESGSPEILNYLKGPSVTIQDNVNAIETIKKHGLYCYGSFVIGAPIDTRETILQTLDFIVKSAIDKIVVNVLTPLPGTELYRQKAGELLTDDYTCFDALHAVTKTRLPREEFYKLYAGLYKQNSLEPYYNLVRNGKMTVEDCKRGKEMLDIMSRWELYLDKDPILGNRRSRQSAPTSACGLQGSTGQA